MKKLKFWIGRTEYIIPVIAVLCWLLFAAGGKWLGWTTYPVGYFQKVFFAIISFSLIMGAGWLTMGSWAPRLKKMIDPDEIELDKLSQWEKIKISFWFYALYICGVIFLASLY